MSLPESLLIANRGEIAVRIIKTCRRLGLRTIAVYSDADAQAMHVAEADEAVRVGPPPAAESYLDAAAILEAARQTGAQAIHPGYGFLSENPDFAEKVIEAGLVWVGPPPAAMRALGDKSHAKALAEKNGVPLLPGYHADDQSPSTLRAEADRVGYPVLIKASAGGGGRGMRVVNSAAEFGDALEAARREARATFGDERVLLERYVLKPRHVEIQIVADQHGNSLHLGERECSIQRRHQKLIEESPSPAVDPALRHRMGEAALRLARAAGYTNAGTVEFLLDDNRDFAFLEVNARLQVEHPVTELVTGLDLVELQLRVASGESLPLAQNEVHLNGHAIEARVIAEDALAGFLPSSGSIERVWFPSSVRIDTWVSDGTRVSPFYDSLLAKVIAHATTRDDTVAALAQALRETRIEGITDNVDLLLATLESEGFARGELHTSFLDEHHLIDEVGRVPAEVLAAASALDHLRPPSDRDPWQTQTPWRLGRLEQPASWTRAGRPHAASVTDVLGGKAVNIDAGGESHHVHGVIAGIPVRVGVDAQSVRVWEDDNWRVVALRGRSFRLRRTQPASVEEAARVGGRRGGAGSLTAPMPGRVVKIAVTQGQHVRQNQLLVVLEAMKMEHVVEAPHAGVVTEVCVKPGEQVASGTRLLTVGADEHRAVQ